MTHIQSTVTDVSKFGRVGVLYGGTSSEREISLLSGQATYAALKNLGINAVAIDAQDNVLQQLIQHELDYVFIALHGPGGEDGTVQGALEYLQLPYTGSGVLASALAMDKQRCKQLWKGIGLPTCDFIVLNEDTDWKAALVDLGGNAMVKPACEGSSIGMRPVENADQLKNAWLHAASFDSVVIAEPLLEGEEYTVAVLGNKALPSIRIRSEEVFYDYKAKYFSDETSYFCPSGLGEDREEEIRQLSLDAFNSLGCIGWGRVDLMVDRQGNFQLLEVNTVPGMTSHSLVPMAAAASGIDFDQLVLQILQEALR
jgi:D-alanine-D-alanine ligase